MEPVLEVKDLKKTFCRRGQPDILAVDGISFQLCPGETLGIVGESGCGKSTTAKLVTRLLDSTGGQIFLEGQDITAARRKEVRAVYRKLQMVFQSPPDSFDPRRTLGDAVGESLRNAGMSKGETKKRVAELLKQCGLPEDFANRYPHEASGGQCQRAAIARAIAVQPKILICDEATSALDVTVQAQVIALLRDLQEHTGMAYLFICHDLALVQQFCDRVLVMRKGKIVEEGTPDEVIFAPKTEYAKQLAEAAL